MSSHDCKGCGEYRRVSRRQFLRFGGTAMAGLATSLAQPSWLPRTVFADSENSARDVVVSVFLRGGADGLSLCVPHGEAAYHRLRPNLAVPRTGPAAVIDLDGFFGLPPALRPLLEAYRGGDLAIVHACGLENSSRSHFDAMHFVEVGQGDAPANRVTGWLGRHLAATAPSQRDAVLRAVAIGYGVPRTLVGGPRTVPIDDLGDYGFDGGAGEIAERRQALAAMYTEAPELLRSSAENTFRTVDLLERIDFAGYRPAGSAVYPENEFGLSLRSSAALIKAEVGVEAISIDLGGWDTHEMQGTTEGDLAQLMTTFGQGLAAFHRDLTADGFDRVSLVAISEFGRNAAENGSRGTDHGHGGALFALGAGVRGGQIYSNWPGLEPDQLYEGQDLQVTTDYRDIYTEMLRKRLGNNDHRTVFDDPTYTPKDLGIFT
ncbi:MAG: DUF1501 domain-containing protein [Acidobacteriota bacterium]